MSLDDEVRKHLRDTGEQVALTPGIVDAVRVRAATRLRRRRRLLTGVGFLAGVALVGGSLAVVLPGSDENSGIVDLVAQQEATDETQDLVVESSDVSEHLVPLPTKRFPPQQKKVSANPTMCGALTLRLGWS